MNFFLIMLYTVVMQYTKFVEIWLITADSFKIKLEGDTSFVHASSHNPG